MNFKIGEYYRAVVTNGFYNEYIFKVGSSHLVPYMSKSKGSYSQTDRNDFRNNYTITNDVTAFEQGHLDYCIQMDCYLDEEEYIEEIVTKEPQQMYPIY